MSVMNDTPEESTTIIEQLRILMPGLSKAESRVAQWIIQNELHAALETGASLAARAGVSEITVGRFLRKLGLSGMHGLRDALRDDHLAQQVQIADRRKRLSTSDAGIILRAEAEAVLELAKQVDGPNWAEAVAAIGSAKSVHVTGFQSIRGLAEDFARRLTFVLPHVRFVAPYDGMLAEWLDDVEGDARVLILFDIAPYARIAEKLVQLALANGFVVIVITDEMNGWAASLTPHVFHAATKVGAFLESVGSLAVLSSMLLHGVAGHDEARSSKRMSEWPKKLHGLNLV